MRRLLSCAALILAVGLTAAARADTVSVTGPAGFTAFSFQISHMPTNTAPDTPNGGGIVFDATLNNGHTDTFEFYPSSGGGGMTDKTTGFAIFLNSISAPALYNQDDLHPVISDGTFQYSLNGNLPLDYTVSITPDTGATPEPSSLVLLGTGVLGLAGAVRRRLVR